LPLEQRGEGRGGGRDEAYPAVPENLA